MVYTNSSNPLHRELNSAVRKQGRSFEVYMEYFPFKAWHFYLTRALKMLRAPESCKEDSQQTVFRGVGNTHFKPKKLQDNIRLDQFSSISEEQQVAQKFSNAAFTLSTCLEVSIKNFSVKNPQDQMDLHVNSTKHYFSLLFSFLFNFSVFLDEQKVLIPPNEVFSVSNFSQDGTQNLVTLRRLRQTCSNFNCAFLRSDYYHNRMGDGTLESKNGKFVA
ncbi:ecto-ADP-ribosyltransferase 5-like [Sarcophilus harrisii]